MSASSKVVAWFEIPSVDFARAVRFYEAALDVKLRHEEVGGQPIAIFGYEEPATGGAIVHSPSTTPSGDGVLVYLNAHPTVAA
ncbi:VOC family protein, partial [Escherichia coli]|nr:VOC family protein [Escherichia coli]